MGATLNRKCKTFQPYKINLTFAVFFLDKSQVQMLLHKPRLQPQSVRSRALRNTAGPLAQLL